MTLRPASAMWSSEVTPGVLPTTRRRSVGTPSSMSSLMTSDELGTTSRCSGPGLGHRGLNRGLPRRHGVVRLGLARLGSL